MKQLHNYYFSTKKITRRINRAFPILIVLFALIYSSCAIDRTKITVYGLVDDPIFIRRIIQQYNKFQKEYIAEYRDITEYELRHVLDNNMQRENLYFIITRHTIIERANQYLVEIFPEYQEDARTDDLNQLGVKVLQRTLNYGYPLYISHLDDDEGVEVATLAIPRTIYKLDHYGGIIDFFQFASNPEINAQALLYRFIPIYKSASIDLLSDKEQGRVRLQIFPEGKLDFDLQPLYDAFFLAK